MKVVTVVLSGSKEQIRINEQKLADFLKELTIKRGDKTWRCATISWTEERDKESYTGSHFKIDDFPKIEGYLKGYRGVVLIYHHKGKIVDVHTRGRRWRINRKGKEVYDR